MVFNLKDLVAQYGKKVNADDFPEEKTRFTDDKRTEARLLAVQSLFASKEFEGSAELLVNSMIKYSGLKSSHLDKKLAAAIINYVMANAAAINEEIALNLDEKWTLDRIEPVAKVIIQAAVGELKLANADSKVIVSEYMAIANSLLDLTQVKFINGVLATIISKYEL